jgi:hypothetical protein
VSNFSKALGSRFVPRYLLVMANHSERFPAITPRIANPSLPTDTLLYITDGPLECTPSPAHYPPVIMNRLMSNTFQLISLLTALRICCGPAFAQTCYWPDGSIAGVHVPCNPAATYSACCSFADYCLSNSLCFDAGANNILSRGSCTDPTFQAQECPRYCLKCMSNLPLARPGH